MAYLDSQSMQILTQNFCNKKSLFPLFYETQHDQWKTYMSIIHVNGVVLVHPVFPSSLILDYNNKEGFTFV